MQVSTLLCLLVAATAVAAAARQKPQELKPYPNSGKGRKREAFDVDDMVRRSESEPIEELELYPKRGNKGSRGTADW